MVESRRETAPARGHRRPRARPHHAARCRRLAIPIRRAPSRSCRAAGRSLLGIFRALPGGTGVIDPIDRKQLREWPVPRGEHGRRGERRAGPLRAGPLRALRRPRRARHRTPRQPVRAARDQPDRHPRPRHSRRVPASRARRKREAATEPDLKRREDLRAAAARHHRSRPTRAIMTMRSGPSPIPIRRTAAAMSSSSPSPMSRPMCSPAPRSTTKRASAATRSISPTASCRCCPSASRTISAR